MRAIILAAGRGARMKEHTELAPKCLLEFQGKALLDWQLKALRDAGISEIAIVTGYRSEMLRNRGLVEFNNARWDRTNMLSSLLSASEWLTSEPCIVTYSDIVYWSTAIETLMDCESDLAITYDPNWLNIWRSRFSDPIIDAETFRVSPQKTLVEIGCKPKSVEEIQGQFMGVLRITPIGWAEIIRVRGSLPATAQDQLQITSTLQMVIERENIDIEALPYVGGWMEFDSIEDFAVAEKLFEK